MEQKVQFDKIDIIKSIKKINPLTYINIENLTTENLQMESKKSILDIN